MIKNFQKSSLVFILLCLFLISDCFCVKEYDFIILGGASVIIASVELAKKFPQSSVWLLERWIDDTELDDTHKLSGWPGILVNNNGNTKRLGMKKETLDDNW